jgi:putative sigma-54 modulation protein
VQVVITGRHLALSDEIQSYTREKANKLTRYYDRILSIEVVMTQDAGRFLVEMIVSADHRQEFVGHERHDDLFAAVDLLMDKMERQLTRHKEKLRNRKHPHDRDAGATEAGH